MKTLPRAGVSRRDLFRTAGIAAAAGLPRPPAAAAAGAPDVYTRVGVRPFINLTATYTINGGTLTLPEVKRAMEEASHHSVNLDELMEKVGARIAELLGAESAIVTSGAAGALSHATAASIPMVSSFPTFIMRPKAWCGALLAQAARTRSRRPSRRPAHCGPRMIFPPE